MKNIEDYLTPHVIDEIREQIAEADGNEVFFIGKTNADKIVEHVDIVARGNAFSVPMVREMAVRSDVIIHNHPSDLLVPSNNDVIIAHQLANEGVASYIVNNEVTDIYVIVEPLSKEEEFKLDIDLICESLSPGGVVSRYLKTYEYRPQQLEMIKRVAEAFNQQKIAVVEAGTGVGKSLAYLIPAIYWSTKNHERCVVSTKTINLQEQLIKKDIPFLKRALGMNFNAILVKGRSNYLCLRKVDSLQREQELLIQDASQQEIETVIEWSRTTKDGSKSDLNFIPNSSVWEMVASESDNCLRSSCEFYKTCFVFKARRRASQANILVANHHLLFSDLAVRALGVEVAVLPSYHHIIFDEAHNIEDIATDYFGAGITRTGISRILRRLHHQTKKRNLGYLNILAKKLSFENSRHHLEEYKLIIERIQSELIPQCEAAFNLNEEVMDEISRLVTEVDRSTQNESRLRIRPRLSTHQTWNALIIPKIKNFIGLLNRFRSGLYAISDKLESVNIKLSKSILYTKVDIDAQRKRIKAIIDIIEEVMLKDDRENIRWLEVIQRKTSKPIVRLKIAPLNISQKMEALVYRNYKTIVMTSATLAISNPNKANEFAYFFDQVGLHLVASDKLISAKIAAPFDYEKQAIVAIPTDIPDPNSREFSGRISEVIFQALKISQGRAFVLFTSYGLLNTVFNNLEKKLTPLGISSLRQGQMVRHQLLQVFKKDKNSVLFATDSFWQGVDVEGEALESVIITKLPFKVPSEPIIEARVEAISQQGGNAFMEYSVPQAVIQLKQGFGRLIRKKTDRGSVIILDKRIIEKSYGRIFLRSLPPSRIVTGSTEEVLQEVERFLQQKG